MSDKILMKLEFHKVIDKLKDHASTELGRELAESLKPARNYEDAVHRLKQTEEAWHVIRLKGGVPFGGIRNVSASLMRAKVGASLNAMELLDIASTIQGGRRLKRALLAIHDDYPLPILHALSEQIADLKLLQDQIKGCINDQAEVVDHASPELARIRKELRLGENRVREKLEQMLRSSSVQKMLQDQLITVRNDRFVLPIKQEYKSHFPGIVHDQSSSGATFFIEPQSIVNLNNQLREWFMQENKEVEKILRELSAQVSVETDALTINLDMLAQIDFIFAKAGLAYALKAVLPIMNDRGYMRLKKARHPLIAQGAVPIEFELGNEFSAMMITGPNTGGKTVTLKTIGLLSLMAAAGLYIPAQEESELCVFDAIYADIGDEQSIEQNLSTFSSHMTNIIGILRDMTPKSLVLLDELGAGTDPAEGSALAIAIVEHIHQLGCRIVATTHYSELKTYAYEREGIINASMEFDVQTLSPTYRLLIGVPGRSNAFAIAERLGLGQHVIEFAKGRVKEEDMQVEHMIASLQEDQRNAEQTKQEADRLKQEAEMLRKQLEAERQRFDDKRENWLRQAQQEASDIVAKAKRESDEIIGDLRKMALEEATSIKEHKLIEMKRRLDDAQPQIQLFSSAKSGNKGKVVQVKPGDEVRVLSLSKKGIVLEEAGDSEVTVQLGIMKMKIKRNDLELVEATATQAKPQAKGKNARSTSNDQAQYGAAASLKRSRDEQVRTELDLRGMNLEEALIETDRFLDESFLSHLGLVYIIHGKGTGVLRSGIHDFLHKHRIVKSYRLGNYGEGGTGVTVVEF